MNDAALDITRWDHWLLLVSFIAIAASGLWLSWQWKAERNVKRHIEKRRAIAKSRLSRQLALEVYHRNEANPAGTYPDRINPAHEQLRPTPIHHSRISQNR